VLLRGAVNFPLKTEDTSMTWNTSAGVIMKLSAGVPATFNAAGYGALSMTTVGEVTSLNGFGVTWSNQTGNQLALRGTQKKKTVRDPGALDVGLNLDTDDAGQVLMKQARDSATGIYSAGIYMPNGDIYFCQVLVNSFMVGAFSQDGKQTATAACAVTTSPTDVDWVEVLA
jgi:hypothetical protein